MKVDVATGGDPAQTRINLTDDINSYYDMPEDYAWI